MWSGKRDPSSGVYMPPWGLNSTTSDIPSDTPRQLWGSHLPTCTAGGWEEQNCNELWTWGLRSEAAKRGAGHSCRMSGEKASEEENPEQKKEPGLGRRSRGNKVKSTAGMFL